MTERWVTAAEVITARDRLEQALGGWQRPAAYAIATGTPDEVVFWRVNVGDHPLPAVVLATVTGYRGGPASYQLSAAVLDERSRCSCLLKLVRSMTTRTCSRGAICALSWTTTAMRQRFSSAR